MRNTSSSIQRADVYSRVTAEIIAAIEQGAGEWRAPWFHNGTSVARPTNVSSGKRYRGINTLALWADSNSDRRVLAFLGIGWEMPATWFQSVNPMFIFLFTPFINVLWARQARAGTEPNSVVKMAIGCTVLGVSYLVMLLPAKVVDAGQLASMWWLIGSTAMLTVDELYLSPVGLSLVTKIAPPRIVSSIPWKYSSPFFSTSVPKFPSCRSASASATGSRADDWGRASPRR